jgi:hypothetical protein
MESHGGMILTGENRRNRRKTCPSERDISVYQGSGEYEDDMKVKSRHLD